MAKMAVRGPRHSISIPGHRQRGSGGTPDSSRRGRVNRSSGSSGASSRDHSVEGRGDRLGSVDVMAAYHGQYRKQEKKDFHRVSWSNHMPPHGPVESGFLKNSKGGKGNMKTDTKSEGNSNQHWRSSRGAHNGTMQGVFPAVGGPRGNESNRPNSQSISTCGRGSNVSYQRQENGYSYHHRHDVDFRDPYQRQENAFGGCQRQDKIGHRRQENAHTGQQNQDGYGGNAGQEKSYGIYHGRRSYRGFSHGGNSRGRELGAADASVLENVREQEIFGPPGSLSRTNRGAAFQSPKEELKIHQGRHDDIKHGHDNGGCSYKSPRDGDLRSSLSTEFKGREEGWNSEDESVDKTQTENDRDNLNVNQEHHDELNLMGRGHHVQDASGRDDMKSVQASQRKTRDGASPSPSYSNKSLTKTKSLSGREEFPMVSPNCFSKGSFSRTNSFERKKGDDSVQVPVLSSIIAAEVDMNRQNELHTIPCEKSISEFFNTSNLNEDERWSETKQSLNKVWECASAGMHRTRSTDWYEICLQEEKEEEVNSLNNNSRQERFMRGDPAEIVVPNISTLKGNSDPEVGQSLFMPWNTLPQSRQEVKHTPKIAPRSKSLLHKFEESSGEPKEIVTKHKSLHGGGQAGALVRRSITTTPEVQNWRTGRRLPRTFSDQGAKPEQVLVKSVEDTLGGAVLIKSCKTGATLCTSVNDISNDGAPSYMAGRGSSTSKDSFGDGSRAEILEKPKERPSSPAVLTEDNRSVASVGSAMIAKISEDAQNWKIGKRQLTTYPEKGLKAEKSFEKSLEVPLGITVPTEVNKNVLIFSENRAVTSGETQNWRTGRRQLRISPEQGFRAEKSFKTSAQSIVKGAVPIVADDDEISSDFSLKTAKREDEVAIKRTVVALRPTLFYRSLQEPLIGDEELLPHIIGTCLDMCPGPERLHREKLRDLAIFERVHGNMGKSSRDLAVKKFCRTVVPSELKQSDVRPLPVLWRTLQYLFGFLDDPEFSFDIVHNFLFDRTRGIMQDLRMQRTRDRQTITIHEEIVRFHIISQHELHEQNKRRSKQVDTHLNIQQLSKSLQTLLNLYNSLGGDGAHFENVAEFHAYYVLLNIGNQGGSQSEPLSLWFQNVPSHVLEGPPMKLARRALRLYRNQNFVGYFRLVRDATYLQCCLLELNFDSIRACALAMLNVAEYKLHPLPLSDLAKQLILEEDEVDNLCKYYGLLTGLDKSTQKHCLLAKQAQFLTDQKDTAPQFSCPLIDSKRSPSCFLEVKGITNK